jgi:two-component system sensor histidine kinase PhoQ
MKSLRTRLLLAATLVLGGFVLLTGAGLDQAFRSVAQQAERDKMQGLVYALLASAEAGEDGTLTIPVGSLSEPRLKRVDSGLEALILDARGKMVWHAPSFSGAAPSLQPADVGVSNFFEMDDRFALTYGLRWLGEGGRKARRYTLAVLEDKTAYRNQLRLFQRNLWIALGGAAAALILVQFLVLRWGLAPLRRLAVELRRIESGKQLQIEGRYPSELTPLAQGLNAMILAERTQQTRYRNALDDLAHSLKTPLAVLKGLTEDQALDERTRERFNEPIGRIQEIARHQLRKAAAAGRRTLAEPVALRPLGEKIAGALSKVYAGKRVQISFEVPEALRARADEGDLYELLGNLLDNACKWCRTRVQCRIAMTERRLQIRVDDDGPGFPAAAEQLLQRGVRADSLTPGQGLGLGAVAELVRIYEGRIELGRSDLGGARVEVELAV